MKKVTRSQLEQERNQYRTILHEILTIGMKSLSSTCERVEKMAQDKERTEEQQIIFNYNMNYVIAVNAMLHPAWDIVVDMIPDTVNFLEYLKAQRKMAIDKNIIPDECGCTYCEQVNR